MPAVKTMALDCTRKGPWTERACFLGLLMAVGVLALGVGAVEDGSCSPGDTTCAAGETLELVQVVVIHRHGDRAPIAKHAGVFSQTEELENFWTTRLPPQSEIERWGRLNVDPTETHLEKKTSEKYSYPNGHLTRLGASQLRRVGAELRQRYMGDLNFLPSDLPSETSKISNLIYARSTRVTRTVQSVQNLLLGLYPEDHRPRNTWDSSQGAIHISSQDKAIDFMTGMSERRCPKVKNLIQALDTDMQMPSNYSELLNRLSPVVGASSGTNQGLAGSPSSLIDRWIHLGDIGTCHVAHYITPPLNLSVHDIRSVQKYNAWIWSYRLLKSPQVVRVCVKGQRESCEHASCVVSPRVCAGFQVSA